MITFKMSLFKVLFLSSSTSISNSRRNNMNFQLHVFSWLTSNQQPIAINLFIFPVIFFYFYFHHMSPMGWVKTLDNVACVKWTGAQSRIEQQKSPRPDLISLNKFGILLAQNEHLVLFAFVVLYKNTPAHYWFYIHNIVGLEKKCHHFGFGSGFLSLSLWGISCVDLSSVGKMVWKKYICIHFYWCTHICEFNLCQFFVYFVAIEWVCCAVSVLQGSVKSGYLDCMPIPVLETKKIVQYIRKV